MDYRRVVPITLLTGSMLACGAPSEDASLEDNKVVVREFFQAIDASAGSLDFIDEWLTPDFQTHFNSQDAIDLAGYRQFMADALVGFPEMRHEIH